MKLIILDVGGTFRESSEAINEGFRRGFNSCGLNYDFDVKDVWFLRGIGKYNNSRNAIKTLLAVSRAGDSLNNIVNQDEAENILDELVKKNVSDDRIIDKIRNEYKKFFSSPEAAKLIKIFPGAKEAINILYKKYKLAIFTNAEYLTVQRDLKGFDLKKFSVIIGGEHVKNKKPSTDGITLICNKLNIKPSDCAYAGDCVVDIQAAKNAGCKSIALLCGMGMENHLRRENPDFIFKDLHEMAKYFVK